MTTEVLVSKLMESFDDLDRCIEMTKEVLSQKDNVPADVLHRIEQYSDVVIKQRALAENLKSHISNENWDEVTRHVKIINGLSAMIRDDAQAILAGANRSSSEEEDTYIL
jgi:hypothetical protein